MLTAFNLAVLRKGQAEVFVLHLADVLDVELAVALLRRRRRGHVVAVHGGAQAERRKRGFEGREDERKKAGKEKEQERASKRSLTHLSRKTRA